MAAGSEEAALLSHHVSGSYKRIPADIAAVTPDVNLLASLLTPWPKSCHPPREENLCSRFSYFSADPASPCESSSRIETKVLDFEKLRCVHVLPSVRRS